MYTTAKRSAGKKVIAIALAFIMFASMGLDVVAAEVVSAVAKSSVELKVSTAEIFDAIKNNVPAITENDITTLEEAMAEISENGTGEVPAVEVEVKNYPQKLIYDESGELVDRILLQDEVIEETFMLEPILASYVENTLVLPGAGDNGAVISKTELLASIEGHFFIKAEDGENWQALFTFNPYTMEVEVFFSNNTATNLNVKIKIYDESGTLLDTSEISSTVYSLQEEVLTSSEFEEIKAQGFKTELIKVEETQKVLEDEGEAPAGNLSGGAASPEVKDPAESETPEIPPSEGDETTEPSDETPQPPSENSETPEAENGENAEAENDGGETTEPAPDAAENTASDEFAGTVEVTTEGTARSLLALVSIKAEEPEAAANDTDEETPAEEPSAPKEEAEVPAEDENNPVAPEPETGEEADKEDEDSKPAEPSDKPGEEENKEDAPPAENADDEKDTEITDAAPAAEKPAQITPEDTAQVLTAAVLKDENLKTSEKAGVISASVPAQTLMATTLKFSPRFKSVKFTVTFMAGGSKYLESPVVKDDLVGEPASPNPKDYGFVSFRGWYVNEGTDQEEIFDFNQKITSDVTITAKFSDKYLIKYKESATGAVVETKEFSPGMVIPRTSVDISVPSGNRISYWYVEGSSLSPEGHYPQFEFGTEKADSDITLVPFFSDAYLVLFISEGTQVDPQMIVSGKNAAKPAQPTRPGYTFSHWSLTKNGAEFKFNTPIKADTTLYAVWNAKTVNYTLVYWFEKPDIIGDAGDNLDNYEFYKAVTKTALAGTQPNFTAGQLDAITYGTYYKTMAQPVLGNGTSVVNVYFKRTLYTFKFNINVANMESMTVDQKVYNKTGDIDKMYTYQAKFEQSIDSVWPVAASNVATFATKKGSGLDLYGWQCSTGTNSSSIYITKRYTVTSDMIAPSWKSEDPIYFVADLRSLMEKEVSYYLEALPHQLGQGNIVDINGVKYLKSDELSQKFYSPANQSLDPKVLNGFTDGWRKSGENDSKKYTFFYNRLRYGLNFNTVGGNIIPQVSGVMFEQQLSDKKPADPTRAGYNFVGWYTDANYRKPFDFTTATMPNSNLTIFAKWESNANTISFYNSTKDTTPVHTQGVATGGYIDTTNVMYIPGQVVPGKGEFVGWQWQVGYQYTNFPFEMAISKDYSLYAKWKTEEFTLTYDKGLGKATSVVPVDNDKYDIGTKARLKSGETLVPPDGEVFIGWKKDGDTTTYYPGSLITMDGSTKVTARYGKIQDYLTLTFDANHTQLPSASIKWLLKEDETTNLFDGGTWITLEDELIGWNSVKTDAQKGIVEFAVGAEYKMGKTDKVFYAVWKTKKVNIIFTHANNGNLQGKTEYNGIQKGTEWGNAITEVPKPVPDLGYYFTGWTPAIPASTDKITKDETYVASFARQTEITITAKSESRPYNSTALLPGHSITAGSLLGTDKLVEVKYTTAGITDAGKVDYDVKSYQIMRGNVDVTNEYNVTLIPGTLEITKATIETRTLKVKDSAKVYGDADPVYEFVTWPFATPQSDFTIEFDREDKGEDAGQYMVGATVKPKNANYEVIGVVVPGILNILPRPITISVKDESKLYDGTPLKPVTIDPVTGLQFADEIDMDSLILFGEQTSVGVSASTVKGVVIRAGLVRGNQRPVKTQNYVITYVNGKLEVFAAGIDVSSLKVKDETKVYGDAEPVYELEAWPFAAPQSDFIITFDRTDKSENVGVYTDKVVAKVEPKNTNYTVTGTVKPGTLTITKRAVTITVHNKTKRYGDLDPVFTGTVTGVVAGEDLGIIFKRDIADAEKNNVGDDITLLAVWNYSDNYDVTCINAKLTITKRGGNGGGGDPDNGGNNSGGGGGGGTTIVDEDVPTTIIEDSPVPTTNLPETGGNVGRLGSAGNLIVGYAALYAALRKKDDDEVK